jgi:hypothetical protein
MLTATDSFGDNRLTCSQVYYEHAPVAQLDRAEDF